MGKKQFAYVIILSVALSVLANVFFGRLLAVKVSTIPILNRWKILSPQAPIVINTREEVRSGDGSDVLQTINTTKSKISSVIFAEAGQVRILGAAVNLTSDGAFLTAKPVTAGMKMENLIIKLDDGRTAPVAAVALDPATNLEILKANISNVPVAGIGSSKDLAVGQKIIFLAGSFLDHSPEFQNSFVAFGQQDDYGQVKNSDQPSRTFNAQSTGPLVLGEPVLNSNGEVVGIWDGTGIVSGDVAKDLVNLYLGSQGNIMRPAFGFKYKNISSVEAGLTGVPAGARVADVLASGPAHKAGLQVNDIITAVDGNNIGPGSLLELLLQAHKPGDAVKITITRGQDILDLTITAGELK
ncbi:MAG: S1C family serine protease [Patescibacteria group bacterium]|nr:S1C family serine protease [Patescibacteria group bacterium]